MSRQVTSRWELTGVLVAQAAVHIGGLDAGPAQLVQARDGAGRPLLPGTALAGVIRSALRGAGNPDSALWGLPSDSDGDGGQASWVRIDDAPALDSPHVEVRDHVSIDRFHGAAAKGHLFSREVLAAGTRFAFRMVVDAPADGDAAAARTLVEAVAAQLRGPGIGVGAATTRGLGLVRLTDAVLRKSDLATRAGMLAALRTGGEPVDLPTADPDQVPAGVLRIVVPWRPHGPLAVQVSSDGDVVSAFPLTGRNKAGIHLELPGSSIKGVLRSHAERITRTVTGKSASEDFLDQMRADGLGSVAALFGTAAARDSSDRDLPTGRRGALQVATCISRATLPAAQWDAVRLLQQRLGDSAGGGGGAETGKKPDNRRSRRPKKHPQAAGSTTNAASMDGAEQEVDVHRAALGRLQLAVDELNRGVKGIKFMIAHHVAVDRWTGGAADALLFATLEPHATDDKAGKADKAWHPITLDLRVNELGPAPSEPGTESEQDGQFAPPPEQLAALALLLLVLRDLCDGWLGFGHGTTRGAGGVRVDADQVCFTAGSMTGWFSCLDGRSLAQVLADQELTESLTTAWLATAEGAQV
ncbi:CRISPR/Cas system CSM-associated protein Csm3 (group 7 of RAMP superfamily) [Micromonospora sp. Llam0]|uniref:RAMP superfamily CRISPR-associated protein n=1 Tax=Micromonospora sp. Llam0 TaxID=2485143 RepID=UPI000F48E3E9|nr:RAMP superfamily CRISPR-associated protein [Micromonospora sp. Llam0]ROO61306.1 CRISPR/Cas system CSM-associated protein Csm3 (group 7 of RAMP superfamily) [Micromonospora sp. Llam0]